MTKDVIIIGSGGHAKVVTDILEQIGEYTIVGMSTEDRSVWNRLGYPVLGDDSVLHRHFEEGVRHAAIGVGGFRDNRLREKLYHMAKAVGFQLVSAVAPSAVISRRSLIGDGNTIFPNVTINTEVVTGSNVIVATGSTIDHETVIEDHVLLSAGVHVGANVTIKTGALIALGANIVSGVTIGENALVAAGATVVSDIQPNTVVYGTPAKEFARD